MLAWVPGPFEWLMGLCCMGVVIIAVCAAIITLVVVRHSRAKSDSDHNSGPFDGGTPQT